MNNWRRRFTTGQANSFAGTAEMNGWRQQLRALCRLAWRAVVLLLAWTACILVGWLHPVFERWTEEAFKSFLDAASWARSIRHEREEADLQEEHEGA